MPFRVSVDDNFHWMDEPERYELGQSAAFAEALAASCRIVDEYLIAHFKPGMTSQELFRSYTAFGDDLIIIPVEPERWPGGFSAWDYAKRRCEEICSQGLGPGP